MRGCGGKATPASSSAVVRDGDRRGDLGPGPYPELAEDVREVGFDGLLAQEQRDRVTFCDGVITAMYEYYGQHAHEGLLRRLMQA